jgi:gas vesicle protein GvpO
MADLSESQRKRQEARKRRRKQPDEASSNDGADNASQDNEQLQHAVRQAAKGAAAAAAVGAAAAAARKLRSHDGDGQPEPQEQPEAAQQEPEAQAAEPEAEAQQDSDPEPDDEEQREAVAGAGGSEARRVLDRAREQLEDLLGRPVESVSSLERTHGGWVLSLEVVEVERIPETTDVLASYEMELDDDLNLRRYQRARRYIRSRSDDGDER